MPKQTNNSSNNAALKGFALTLVILILAVCVMAAMTEGFSNWNPYGWFDKPAEEQQTPEGDDPAPEQPTEDPAPIEATISNSEHIALSMSAAVTAADGEYVEQTLTATVTPSTAEELGVDWTAEWADGSDSSDLSDYLTITPASDGSNICYVRAYAAFDKDIIITCTTRDGGFIATCTVIFVGNPSEMKINVGELTSIQDSGWGQQIYQIKTNRTYNLNIVFDNFFNQINPSFVPEYEVTITGVGTFDYSVRDTAGPIKNYEDVSLSDVLTYKPANSNSEVQYSIIEHLVDININDDTLVIVPKFILNSNNSFTVPYTDSNGTNWRTNWSFKGFSDESKVPYFQITVKEANTGLSKTINMRIVSGVNGVSLSQSSMTF